MPSGTSYLMQKCLPKTTGRILKILKKINCAVIVALARRAARKHDAASPKENGKSDVRGHMTQEL